MKKAYYLKSLLLLLKNMVSPEFLCESTMSLPGHNEAFVARSCIPYGLVRGGEKRSSASRYNMTAACQTPAVRRHGRYVRGRGSVRGPEILSDGFMIHKPPAELLTVGLRFGHCGQ